jgi:hypothetical protein
VSLAEDATNALGPKAAPMPIIRLIALSGLRIARM